MESPETRSIEEALAALPADHIPRFKPIFEHMKFEWPAAMNAVLDERQRQITDFGHSPQKDDASPRNHLLRTAHVMLLTGADILSRRPNPENLNRARRKAVQAAALCLAEIERIDRELTNPSNQGAPRK